MQQKTIVRLPRLLETIVDYDSAIDAMTNFYDDMDVLATVEVLIKASTILQRDNMIRLICFVISCYAEINEEYNVAIDILNVIRTECPYDNDFYYDVAGLTIKDRIYHSQIDSEYCINVILRCCPEVSRQRLKQLSREHHLTIDVLEDHDDV